MAAGLVVAACGGGGSTTTNAEDQGGAPIIQPSGATFYAGVPNTIYITGGRRPYTVTSSEPSLLPVPASLDAGSFDVVPANPGVIDANLPPGSIPLRTVNIEVRDSRGQTAAPIQIKVGQNFLLGYGISFTSNCPAPPGTSIPACSGGETAVHLISVTNGNLFGDRQVTFSIQRGPLQFVWPDNSTHDSVTVTTDHEGQAQAIMRVNANVTGQLAVIRVTDTATKVYIDNVVPINGTGPSTTLTAIPSKFTFTGPLSTICGTGTGQFLVFDGQPPYTAVSSSPNVTVNPTVSNSNPGVFTVSANNPNVCLTDATIVITDSAGGRTTVTVSTATGTQQPPQPPPLSVAPTSLTLVCGTSGSVSVVGGISNGSYFVNSTNPRVTAVVSGNTVTITRLAGDPVGSSFPTSTGISVSDGATIQTVTVSAPAFCP